MNAQDNGVRVGSGLIGHRLHDVLIAINGGVGPLPEAIKLTKPQLKALATTKVYAMAASAADTNWLRTPSSRAFCAEFIFRRGGQLMVLRHRPGHLPGDLSRPVILHDAGTRTVTITLAADTLFALGSAAVDPTADSALTQSLSRDRQFCCVTP